MLPRSKFVPPMRVSFTQDRRRACVAGHESSCKTDRYLVVSSAITTQNTWFFCHGPDHRARSTSPEDHSGRLDIELGQFLWNLSRIPTPPLSYPHLQISNGLGLPAGLERPIGCYRPAVCYHVEGMTNNRAPTYASVRVSPQLRVRVDALVDRMAERSSGLRPTMASVLLAGVARGLPVLEVEQGLAVTPATEGTPAR